MMSKVRKLIIIGSGPAAHTAAIYAARAELQPLMYEGFMAGGVAAGGQLTTTTDVENYPGFPEGVNGYELMERMRQQSLNCGAEIRTETVAKVDFSVTPFKVFAEGKEDNYEEAHCVILATGATAKRMNLPGESEFWNKGMSACAVCDGAAPLFRNKPLLVIGGGDSACEEASFLTKYGSSVTLFVRRNELRASMTMRRRVEENPKINIMFNTEATEACGGELLERVKYINNLTNEKGELEVKGLFYAIGHSPNTTFLQGQIKCDKDGYVITKPGTCETNITGVFACGDVQDKKWRQAVTAAGSGCMAALSAEHYLSSMFNKM